MTASHPPAGAGPVLSLQNIHQRFSPPRDGVARLLQRWGWTTPTPSVQALDGVSLDVHAGEVVGLVGESGCGKSTLGRVAAGLYNPTQGQRLWKGQVLQAAGSQGRPSAEAQRQQLAIQMIFQDPYASLNPRMRVLDIVGEAPVAHGLLKSQAQRDRVVELLEQVGMDASALMRFPHQFSGGQRARIGIARALAVEPEFLICDEAVAALDVSIQAQVINLFMALRERLKLTYLFISHDLGVVQHISDRVVVMYLGRVVEQGPTDELFSRPQHPYTQALLAETPRLDVRKKTYSAIQGELPSPLNPPSGCHFHPRCPHAMAQCATTAPRLLPLTGPGGTGTHAVACHRVPATTA